MIDTYKLAKQKKYLDDLIKNGSNKDKFNVIDLEAGTGKTLQAEISLANSKKKSIFVRERIEDCIESANRINEVAGIEIAIAINSETVTKKEWQTLQNQIKHYPVVVIAHEKYKALSVDKKNREIFTYDREILIVDEFLNMTKGNELHINKKWIEEFETLLQHRALRNLFAECIAEIEEYLILNKKPQSFFNAKNDVTSKISRLKQLTKENLSAEVCTKLGYTKNQIIESIDNLKQFYNQTCVVEGKMMYCTNRKYQYWLLANNVMLDASGNLNKAYSLSSLFEISRQGKVLDHSKWSFYISKTNSTMSAKKKAVNYHEVVNSVAEKLDNPLIVGNKEESVQYQSDNVNWFGNLTGSNEYRDLTDCIIAHNPNTPYRTYVLEYLYYSNVKLDNRSTWSGSNVGKGDNRVYRFKDKRFEDYRLGRNANEIYQAIKRVNRGMKHNSKVFIFNNDMEVVNKVVKMFKKLTVIKEFENTVEFEKSKKQEEHLSQHNQKQKNDSYAMTFIGLLQEIKKGKYKELSTDEGIFKKSVICELIGLNSKNFSKQIGNKIEVIDYCNRNNVEIKGQSIILK